MNLHTSSFTTPGQRTRAITVIQILIAVAVAAVLFAVAYPVYLSFREKAHKQVALDKIRMLGGALTAYASQNNGALPEEDAKGNDDWSGIAKPAAKNAWYNALPRQLGKKGAGDFSDTPASFYTDENILFLPGANYPDKKKLMIPMFAVAINTKLERTEADGGVMRAKMSDIANPSRTVAFLEQGLLNESRTLEIQSKKDYDGSPKGSAKSFVGRYDDQGVLCFFDAHVELINAKDVLTEHGDFPFPQTNVIWTPKPEDNPNKDAATKAREKKQK
jgi:Tfp pilus assembly protein PilE